MPVSYSSLTVVSGTTITATWGNNVRDSAIVQQASYSALNSAVTSPTEGQRAYLTDTDTEWYYRNTNWRLVAGQWIYAKWDTSTSFFTNVAAGSYTTAFTSATFNVPSSGTGQAFEVEWQCPHSSGAGTVTRYNSQIQQQINGGAFTTVANAGPVYMNTVADPWVSRGKFIYKAGGSDTTTALRLQAISVGGNFDCIAGVSQPMVLTCKTMGLLTSEIT